MALVLKRTVACIMAACAVAALKQPLPAQQLTALRVGTSASDASKALFYAREAGIFRKYGLDVQITIITSGAAGLAAVAGGELDLTNTSLLPVEQAHLQGLPFQLVVPTNLYDTRRPATVLVVAKDSSIHTGRDLTGKTIGSSSLKDLNTGAAFAWIDQTGGDHRTVKIVELPPPEAVAALDAGRVDAFSLTSPFWDQGVLAGKVRILAKSLDTIAARFEVSGYVGNADSIAKDTDKIRQFDRAMHEAILYTNSHLDATVDLVASYSGIPAAVIAKSTRVIDPEYVDPRLVQPTITAAVKQGLLDRSFDASEIISNAALSPPR